MADYLWLREQREIAKSDTDKIPLHLSSSIFFLFFVVYMPSRRYDRWRRLIGKNRLNFLSNAEISWETRSSAEIWSDEWKKKCDIPNTEIRPRNPTYRGLELPVSYSRRPYLSRIKRFPALNCLHDWLLITLQHRRMRFTCEPSCSTRNTCRA